MAYKYLGAPYPPDVGVLLPGLSVALFPLEMTDAEVKLLLDQYPYLRGYWEDDGLPPVDDSGGGGAIPGDGNGNGVPDVLDGVWNGLLNLDPLLRRLIQENESLSGTVNWLTVLVSQS